LEENKGDMYKAAEYWKQAMLDSGCDKAVVMETKGNPVTFGEKMIDASLPTVLVYGHMDVMPVDPIELWKSPPFEPEVRDGKIWARGADDDKGQAYMHAKAFELMMNTDTLPCNVKFIIEGEEEIGSPNLKAFMEENKDMLAADIILVSDTGMIASDIPSITTGLRGLSYMEVEVTGPNKDLHSGLFGGAVANPANVLTKLIASLTDDDGKITVKGFYDDVIEVGKDERAEMAKAPFDEEGYKKALDIGELSGEKGYSTNERTGIRPALDVNGIWAGYTGEGATPNTVKVKVTALHGGQGYVSPVDIPAYVAADKAYTDVFGKRPVPVRSGGSIPIISTFEEVLGIKSILMGFGLESNAIHSPNENFPLEMFYKGIKTIPLFYKYYAELMKK